MSLAAGLGGLVLAYVGIEGLVALIPPTVPLTESVRIDKTVLFAGFALSAVLAPFIGLLPALSASRARVADLLRAGGRGSTSGDRRLRSALVVAEVAMAVVLLAGAGLLLRSAAAIQSVDPGFDARASLIAHVNLTAPGEEENAGTVQVDLLERVRGMPGVVGAGAIGQFFVERIPDQTIRIVGDPPRSADEVAPRLTTDMVLPGFFESLGVPLLQGRYLSAADIGGSAGSGFALSSGGRPSIVLVNQSWVETFAAGRDPVGLQFRWGDQVEGDAITVVGVVGDLRRTTLEEVSYPQMFLAGRSLEFDLVISAAEDPLGLVDDLRALIVEVDPMAALSNVSTAWDRYDRGLAPRHFQTLLFGVFAALATLLAAIGLFAILHDAVASRRREIGIRIALGAAPAGVRSMVLRQGLGLAAVGLLIGLVATLAMSSVLSRLVYGIESTDPVTLTAVGAVLLAVTAIAAAVPAVAATRVAPVEVLTSD